MQTAVKGRSILVVEDNAIVAIDLEMMLREAGAEVVGPIDRIADALDQAENGNVEAAVLDIEIGGEMIYPVADALRGRAVPMILTSGHGPDVEIHHSYRDLPRIAKPFDAETVLGALNHLFEEMDSRVA